MHDVPVLFELVSGAVLLLVLLTDVVLAYRNPEQPSTRQSALWVAFYVVLALAFALLLLVVDGPDRSLEFVAGWLTEYSLSIDNLFVFIVIMSGFAVPRKHQQEVLMYGILLALLFRGVFILVGAQLIASFSWIFYIFGAFLVVTAVRQVVGGEHGDAQNSRLVRLARRRLAITEHYDEGRFRTTVDGRRMWTPIIIVLVALGSTDVLFALDSIPAIFGITDSPFIVFTANVFALMGLRQLYFLLGDLVERLRYLKYGIAFILAFIGVKLVLHALHDNELPFVNGGEHLEGVPDIGIVPSLLVIVGAMAVATIASLVHARRTGEPITAKQEDEQRRTDTDTDTADGNDIDAAGEAEVPPGATR